MENSNELMHHGTKGMRWGVRRYQNPDGSLTPAGKKRYNKEVEKLKAEEAKIKAAEKVAANKKKTQTKLDKLDAKRAELDERKKKLKSGDVDDSDKKKDGEETVEQKRERLLKSTDPKEILKDKDVLTNYELQERVNRINLEAQLQSKIPVEPKEPTLLDRADKARNAIDKATNLYRSIDNAVSAVGKSYIGKTLAETLDIKLPEKPIEPHNAKKFLKDIDKKTNEQVAKEATRLKNEQTIRDAVNGVANKPNNSKGLDTREIQSMIDDAIANAMAEREDK